MRPPGPSAYTYLKLLYEPIGLFVQLIHQDHLSHFDLVFHLPVLMLYFKNPGNMMGQTVIPLCLLKDSKQKSWQLGSCLEIRSKQASKKKDLSQSLSLSLPDPLI